MNKRTLGIGFAILFTLIGLTQFYLFQQEKPDLEKPLELFQNHHYAEALQFLDRNQKAYPEAAYYLKKSYIQRELGNKQQAFQNLWKSTQLASSFPDLLAEAHLNLMLDAYLEQNSELLKSRLLNFKKFLNKDPEWLSLFMATVYEKEGDAANALEALNTSVSRSYKSPWMEERFSEIFNSYWYAKHMASCKIRVGKTEEARRILKEKKSLFFPEHEEVHNYLQGLSYIVEAQRQSYDSAIPGYRFAALYLDHVSDEKLGLEMRVELIVGLNAHIRQAVQVSDFENIPFYVELIEKWGGEKQAQELTDLLIAVLDQVIWKENNRPPMQLIDTLSYLLKESKVRNQVGLRFENLLEAAMQKDGTALFEVYWKMVRAFCDDDQAIHGKFSNLAAQKVIQSIVADDSLLTKTSKNLDFYLLVEEKPEDSLQLARQLVMIAERYWEIPQKRPKAVQLLKAAKRTAPADYAADVQASIENMFKNRYENALNEDMIADLFDLMSAADTLNVASINLQDSRQMQQQLDDAEYLYLQGSLAQALQKAEWVLAIDPNNLRARRLSGMIAYYFADYQKAKKYLKGMAPANDEMKEAQGVVALLTGDPEKGKKWLEEVQKARPVQEQIYLRLAYESLSQESPVEALNWLAMVDPADPEVLPARIFAAYQLDSWNEVVDLFKKLGSPYENLDGYRGLAVDSLIALGEEKEAERVLDQLLRKPPQPDAALFSPYFQKFKKDSLDKWNRFFVAGLYFKVVRNDPENALRYFDKILEPSVWAQFETAEVYFQLGRIYEAKELLLKLNSKTAKNQLEVKLRVLPLLGKAFQQLGDDVGAIPFYLEYFKLKSDDAKYRYSFIEALMHIRRYDLALKQVQALKGLRALNPEEQIAWMRSLLHKGEFNFVNQIANQWLSNQKVPLFQRLQIARMMVVTKNRSLLDYIVKGIPEPSQRSARDNEEMIRLWMELGGYVQALDLAQTLEKQFIQTPEGLMVLARLYSKLSRMDESVSYAEKVLQIDPTNKAALDFIQRQDQHAEVIASLVKLLKERVEDNPDDVALQIDYAKNLIELAMEAYLAGAISRINDSIDLQQARLILEKLSEREFKLPEVFLFLGKVYYLMNLPDRAEKVFEKALAFDPSYIEVLQHLALVNEGKGQIAQAIKIMENASHFAIDNPDVWMQLGNLYIADSNWKKGVGAYQEAVRFAPFDPDPYLRLASVYLKGKRSVEAVKTLEAMLAFSPQNAKGLSLMLQALYKPGYVKQDRDPELLERVRIDYYDRLKSIDPDLARKSLPEGVDLDPK